MEVRKAKLDDARDIAQLLIESWQYAYRGIMEDTLLDNLSLDKRQVGWERHLKSGAQPYLDFSYRLSAIPQANLNYSIIKAYQERYENTYF